MSFLNENVAAGLAANAGFQVGVSDKDLAQHPERGVLLPWLFDPAVSWLDMVPELICYLDSGMVVHWPLPQYDTPADSLGVQDVFARKFGYRTDGVNLESASRDQGVVQRMAVSKYRFCLRGWARRVGYQIPIPKLVTVGGSPAIPDDEQPQRAANVILGNWCGIPIWFARWELWYTVAVPPTAAQDPPPNLAQHMSAETGLVKGAQSPVSVPDSTSVKTAPPQADLFSSTFIRRPRQGPGTAGS